MQIQSRRSVNGKTIVIAPFPLSGLQGRYPPRATPSCLWMTSHDKLTLTEIGR